MEPATQGAGAAPVAAMPIQDIAVPQQPAVAPAPPVEEAKAEPAAKPEQHTAAPVTKPIKQPKAPKPARDHASAAPAIAVACVLALMIAGLMVYGYLQTQHIALF